MRVVDCHSHSLHYSFDATQTVDDLLADAQAHQLAGICLTDHYDKDIVYDGLENIFNIDQYFRHLSPLKQASAQLSTKLLIGIELGWMPNLTALYNQIIAGWSFDSIVLSLHVMDDGLDMYLHKQIFNEGVLPAFSRALKQMNDMVQAVPDFTILGHFDYISRYVPRQTVRMDYQPLADEFDTLFRTLIMNGKSLELNTRTTQKLIHNGLKGQAAWPDQQIFKRYLELGGELISLSSDSHQLGQVATLFPEAIDYLRSLGVLYVTHFEDLKPILTKI
ncbi:MAG: histidinol-phosphatase HisJ family protein [Eubacteriales bacterium]|nr:histidinol-phosphatase HisJ family protein [Eubacteriales bacterium]